MFLLTDTIHSAKDKYFRSLPIGTEVLSFADLKAESSRSQHMNIFKEEGSLAPEFILRPLQVQGIRHPIW